jgi:hypothetical protein
MCGKGILKDNWNYWSKSKGRVYMRYRLNYSHKLGRKEDSLRRWRLIRRLRVDKSLIQNRLNYRKIGYSNK